MLSKWNSMPIGIRLIALIVVGLAAIVSVNYGVFVKGFQARAVEDLGKQASVFTAVADEAKEHVTALHTSGAFNMQDMVAEIEAERASNPNFDYRQTRIFDALPIVAGWKAAAAAAEREGMTFNIQAHDARNKDNEPEVGSFSDQMLNDLKKQVLANGPSNMQRINEQDNTLHYMRAVRLSADCLACHGKPGNKFDTDGDGIDMLGFPMEGWAEGDMHGAFEVVMPLDDVQASVASFIATGLAYTLPVAVLGLGFFYFVMRRWLMKPMAAVVERIRDIAEGEGDLTKRVPVNSGDEIGQLSKWFNAFVDKVHDVIVSVAGASSEVAAAATELAATSEQNARSMDNQRAQVGQIAAAVEEMSSSVVEVSERSRDARERSMGASETAREGGSVVGSTIEDMQLIADAVDQTAASVESLGSKSDEIGAIIEVINDIAEQTNLLALNAAIEAARAGEHGRGFAVVADEVRKLADRTTSATEEIGSSIREIQSETVKAVERMGNGRERVAGGLEQARQAGASLDAIVEGTSGVTELIGAVTVACEQQSAAGEEISRSTSEINIAVSEAAEASQQAAQVTQALSEKSEQLRRLIEKFKLRAPDRRSGNGRLPEGESERRVDPSSLYK